MNGVDSNSTQINPWKNLILSTWHWNNIITVYPRLRCSCHKWGLPTKKLASTSHTTMQAWCMMRYIENIFLPENPHFYWNLYYYMQLQSVWYLNIGWNAHP